MKRCFFANLNLPEASGSCCLAREFRSLIARRAMPSEVFWELYTLCNGVTLNQSDISSNVTL